MKEWMAPQVLDMEVSETKYGNKEAKEFDNIYQNAEGKWEGTFEES